MEWTAKDLDEIDRAADFVTGTIQSVTVAKAIIGVLVDRIRVLDALLAEARDKKGGLEASLSASSQTAAS